MGFGSAPDLAAIKVAPNPFARETTLTFNLDSASDVRIEVFGVTGARVVERELAGLAAGEQRIRLVSHGRDGRALASGVYFCRVSSANGTRVVKLVVER